MQDYRRQLPTDARLLYDDLIENNVAPRFAAAAARYTHSLLVDEDITQAGIAEQYDTSTSTIRKWFHWLVDNSDHIGDDQPSDDTESPPSVPHTPRCVNCGTIDVTIHDWSDGKRVDCSDCNHSQFWVTDE